MVADDNTAGMCTMTHTYTLTVCSWSPVFHFFPAFRGTVVECIAVPAQLLVNIPKHENTPSSLLMTQPLDSSSLLLLCVCVKCCCLINCGSCVECVLLLECEYSVNVCRKGICRNVLCLCMLCVCVFMCDCIALGVFLGTRCSSLTTLQTNIHACRGYS